MPAPIHLPKSRPRLGAVALLRRLGYWAPVWVPVLLLWQFSTRGLVPALEEARRLEGVEPEVHARHAEAKSAFEHIRAEAEAWQDPVYRERRRRLRLQQNSEPDAVLMDGTWEEGSTPEFLDANYGEDPDSGDAMWEAEELQEAGATMEEFQGGPSPAEYLDEYAGASEVAHGEATDWENSPSEWTDASEPYEDFDPSVRVETPDGMDFETMVSPANSADFE
ncbi:MAG: hypothetical protein KDB61_11055 [Planctomycetes bacterium]|nr:hypothetical protein [Planctomycetota bacterium]